MIRTNEALLHFFAHNANWEKLAVVQEKQFAPGEKLIVQGTPGRYVHVIKKGLVKCVVHEENGREFIQEFFGQGALLGEIEILNPTISFSNIVALTSVDTYFLEKKGFEDLMEHSNKFGRLLSRSLALKLRDTAVRASSQQTHPIEHNLKLLSLDQIKGIPKKDLADYLGITLRSLNRNLKEMQDTETIK